MEDFEVEKILEVRNKNGKFKFKIKWEGFPIEESTYEPLANLEGSKEILADFFVNEIIKELKNPIFLGVIRDRKRTYFAFNSENHRIARTPLQFSKQLHQSLSNALFSKIEEHKPTTTSDNHKVEERVEEGSDDQEIESESEEDEEDEEETHKQTRESQDSKTFTINLNHNIKKVFKTDGIRVYEIEPVPGIRELKTELEMFLLYPSDLCRYIITKIVFQK